MGFIFKKHFKPTPCGVGFNTFLITSPKWGKLSKNTVCKNVPFLQHAAYYKTFCVIVL